jgi:hypothetical protein
MFVTRGRYMRRSAHVARLAFVLVGLLSFAITGCVETRARYTPVPATPTSTSTPTPTPTPIPLPTATMVPPTPTSVPTATPEPTATPIAVPTVIPTPLAVPTVSSGTFNLALNFEGIGDESIVRSDTVLLRGITSADAIVSVNDVIVEVQADGTFELTIVLVPGPNFVDVVASNLDGSAHSSSLAIISIPPQDVP